jgi:hypothetical protein
MTKKNEKALFDAILALTQALTALTSALTMRQYVFTGLSQPVISTPTPPPTVPYIPFISPQIEPSWTPNRPNTCGGQFNGMNSEVLPNGF